MSTAARVVKNTFFLYVQIAINIVISIYSTRLVLEALGVEDFGIYQLVGGTIAMLSFLNSAMAEASQRFMSYAHGEGDQNGQNKIFNVSFILHLLIGFIVVVILELLGYFLFRSILNIPAGRVEVAKLVYHFMVVSTFFSIVKVPYDAVLNAHENMLIVAILGIVQSVLKLGIAIYLSYTMYDQLVVYGALMSLLAIFLVIISYVYCNRKYSEVRINFSKGNDRKLFKDMGRFASWALVSQSAFIVTLQGTTVVLNSYFGVVVNAAQGIANQISNQINSFANTLSTALNPVIVKNEGGKNRQKMLEAASFGNKMTFFVTSLMSIPLIIEMPYILELWLTDVPEFSVLFCRLILFRMVFGTLSRTYYVAIGAIGDIKKDALWESLIFISILPFSILLYELGASAEATYIVFLIMTVGIVITRVYFLHKLGGLSIPQFIKNVVLRCLGVFILVFLLASVPLLLPESFWRLLTVLIVSTISSLIIIYLLGFNKEEKQQTRAVALSFLKSGTRRL